MSNPTSTTYKYTNKLHNTRVLVLGGTSGIGFCFAENALENGATVIVASSRQSSIDRTISRFQQSYPDLPPSRVSGHVIDLRNPNDLELEAGIVELLKFATNDGKHLLDHIVSTAGDALAIGGICEFAGTSTLASALRVRTVAPLFLAKHAPGKYLRVSSRSSITLTGGVNTYKPAPNWFMISLMGGAVDGMMRGLAVDLKPIRVNVVAPGAIHTELFDRSFGEGKDGMVESFAKGTLVGKVGTPEDMSEAYVYVMRDGFLTGQTVLSEGGSLIAPGQ